MMAMTPENEIGDDPKEVSESVDDGPKSPWKRPVDKKGDKPVMGAEAWPPLSDAQRLKNLDAPSKSLASEGGTSSAQCTSSDVQVSFFMLIEFFNLILGMNLVANKTLFFFISVTIKITRAGFL